MAANQNKDKSCKRLSKTSTRRLEKQQLYTNIFFHKTIFFWKNLNTKSTVINNFC